MVSTELDIEFLDVADDERDAFMEMAVQYFTVLNPVFQPLPEWRAHFFDGLKSNPDTKIRWVVSNDGVAGFIIYGYEPHRYLPKKVGVIYDLYLSPDHRRKGIGFRCLQRAVEELHANGAVRIHADVTADYPSGMKALKDLGFKEVAIRLVRYSDREE